MLVKDFYSKFNPDIIKDKYIFTRDNIPSYSYTGKHDDEGNKLKTTDDNRRGYWGKRFNRVIKEPLGFSKDHTMYSLRHSGIGILFTQKIKEFKEKGYDDYRNKALDSVMLHTVHTTRKTVTKYLREIGYYEIPDWSDTIYKMFGE